MKTIPVRHITATQTEPVNAGRFSVRKLEAVLNGQALVHEMHKHNFYFILALEKGQGIHQIDFVDYEVTDNVVFILRPGQVHQLQLQADCTGFLLEFDTSFYQPKHTITEHRWRKATSKNYCALEESRLKKIISILSNIFFEYTNRQDGYAEAIKANLDLFFIEFVRQSRNQREISTHTGNYTQERYEELLGLLEANISEMKQVSQYAELLNLSTYQLNSITKASAGKTTADLINEQVILEAKRHLLATTNQVKDIAWYLGYEDASYFIRFFKKHTGHSPDAFRKNFK
jgi:AraC family transcriptional regulator, transcriptional activator of pobA